MSIPRSNSRSSVSRSDRPYLTYINTVSRITSGELSNQRKGFGGGLGFGGVFDLAMAEPVGQGLLPADYRHARFALTPPLETPLLKRDFVDVLPQKGVTGGNLLNVVAKYRQSDGGSCTVISNKVKALPNTISHMSARGSNAYIGQDLAQTMTFLTPDEVERLEALNAWTARNDLIRLRHWDQFNQSAGRNLGFRRVGDVRHDLLIGHRLLESLLGEGLGRSRYDLRLHISRAGRYRVRVKAA